MVCLSINFNASIVIVKESAYENNLTIKQNNRMKDSVSLG